MHNGTEVNRKMTPKNKGIHPPDWLDSEDKSLLEIVLLTDMKDKVSGLSYESRDLRWFLIEIGWIK